MREDGREEGEKGAGLGSLAEKNSCVGCAMRVAGPPLGGIGERLCEIERAQRG